MVVEDYRQSKTSFSVLGILGAEKPK